MQRLGYDVLGLLSPTFRCKGPRCNNLMLSNFLQRKRSSSQVCNEWGRIIQPVGFKPLWRSKWPSPSMEKIPHGKVLQRHTSMPYKGQKVTCIMPSKPYLIKEPPKHVHQIPPFQNKQILKDLIKLAKFKYGRVVMVSYWVDHSPSQRMFPKRTLSNSCKRVWGGWGCNFWAWGFLTYKDSYCLIYGCLYRRCVASLFSMQPFSKPFICN